MSTAAQDSGGGPVRVGTVAELEAEGVILVPADGVSVAVFWHDGRAYALDNRCPHLGFPLHRGTVRDGVVTCHWHHAKFDLAGGCTFDAFADDARAYPAWVEDGVVWLGTEPRARDETAHHLHKLEEGLEHSLELVLAKAVLGLEGRVPAEDVIARAARFGLRNRDAGWSDGLSILTALANLRPWLQADDRVPATFHGLTHVARATAGHAPSFDLAPLDTDVTDSERLAGWFRRFCEVRADGAAERTLRAAVAAGLAPRDLVTMVAAACTDHRFLDVRAPCGKKRLDRYHHALSQHPPVSRLEIADDAVVKVLSPGVACLWTAQRDDTDVALLLVKNGHASSPATIGGSFGR
jgi:nitrite reductase/ring-hydroxylating ferredoxin subunit